MSTSNDTHIILDKELRRDIDAIIQRLKEATGEANTPPIPVETQRTSEWRTEARRHLQYAVMSLGMDLKDINDQNPGAVENPYPHSKDPSNTVTGLIHQFENEATMKAFVDGMKATREMPVHGFIELGNAPVVGCESCKGTGVARIMASGRRIPCDCTNPK